MGHAQAGLRCGFQPGSKLTQLRCKAGMLALVQVQQCVQAGGGGVNGCCLGGACAAAGWGGVVWGVGREVSAQVGQHVRHQVGRGNLWVLGLGQWRGESRELERRRRQGLRAVPVQAQSSAQAVQGVRSLCRVGAARKRRKLRAGWRSGGGGQGGQAVQGCACGRQQLQVLQEGGVDEGGWGVSGS